MWSHPPPDDECPFCRFVQGIETVHNTRHDIVYEDEAVLAFISPKWCPNNPGHALIIPKAHVENIYALPDDLAARIVTTAKRVAIAIRRTYACDGTSLHQHNEPAGDQDVFHYHLHVFPRWEGDELYRLHADQRVVGPEERRPYAARLRAALTEPDAEQTPVATPAH